MFGYQELTYFLITFAYRHVIFRIDPNDPHYNDAIMSAMASQITSLTIVHSTVYSGADQRKHQSSASLVFVRGIHRWPVNSPHKEPVTRKMFSFDDVIMKSARPPANTVITTNVWKCSSKFVLLLYTSIESRYIARYNVARKCTQHNKFEGKTLVRLGTHVRQPYFVLTGELWMYFVIYFEKMDQDISGEHCVTQPSDDVIRNGRRDRAKTRGTSSVNTLRPRQNGTISQTTLSIAFCS